MLKPYLRNFTWHQVFKFLTIALAVLLLVSQLYHAFNYPIWRDDAMFDIVAKNLVNGNGYAETLFDKTDLFHRSISSGPTLILPISLMIFFFGNEFWAPSLANTALIWTILIFIFFAAKKIINEDSRWIFYFLSLSLSLFYSMGHVGSYSVDTGDGMSLWHLAMGEVSAALLIILGAFLLFAPQANRRKIFIASLVLGLAVMSKSLTLIASAVILISFAAKIFFEKKTRIQKIKVLAIAAIGFLLPSFLFELAKLILTSWEQYLGFYAEQAVIYKNGAILKNNVYIRTIEMIGLLHSDLYSLGIITFSVIFFSFKNVKNRVCRFLGIILILCFAAHAAWWVNFSLPGSDRHFVLAFFYYFAGLSLLIASIDYKNGPQFLPVSFFIFLLFIECSGAIKYLLVDGFKKNERLQEQLMITEMVKNFENDGVEMFSCGNNFELEYLLPNSGNFKHCSELKKDSKKSSMLVSYFVNKDQVVTLLHDEFKGLVEALPSLILQQCDQNYLTTKNFSLRWCNK